MYNNRAMANKMQTDQIARYKNEKVKQYYKFFFLILFMENVSITQVKSNCT